MTIISTPKQFLDRWRRQTWPQLLRFVNDGLGSDLDMLLSLAKQRWPNPCARMEEGACKVNSPQNAG